MDKQNWRQELEHVVGDFHQCTALAVAGFTAEGELVCSAGVCDHLLRILLHTNTTSHRANTYIADCARVHIPQYGQFVVISMCRKCLDRGYLLLGPFADSGTGSQRALSIVPYLVRLVRFIQDRSLTKSHSHRETEVYCLHVQRALDYIHNHYSEQITLQQMAKVLGLNKSYFSHRFRLEMGATFCQWLNHVRIERSKEYLKHGDKTIAEIAIDVGYTSQSYYTAMFSKRVGVTPTTYRQRWLGCKETTDVHPRS